MSDQLDETHAQVGLAALAANPMLVVFDGVVPNPTPDPPYLLAYTRVEWPRDGIGTAINGTQVTITTTYTLHCVGLTAAAARAVQMQARSSLLNLRPVIAGRNCSPIKQVEARSAARDETTGRLVMDAVSKYDFVSVG